MLGLVRVPERAMARVTRRDVSFTRPAALSRPLASGQRRAGQAAKVRLLPPRGSVASLPRPLYQPISSRPREPIELEQHPPVRRAVSGFCVLIASRTKLLKPQRPPPETVGQGAVTPRALGKEPICSLRWTTVRRTAPDTAGIACPKREGLARAGAEAAGGMPRAIR